MEAFRDDVGHFRGVLETRPYVRARAGLAQALWSIGKREDAIAHYQGLLRLNPNDNQGIRYQLAAGWQAMERYDELDALLDDYPGDGTAAWTYTQALAAFRSTGDTGQSRRVLAMARKSNRHVPALLLGRTKLPRPTDDYITMGGKDEAIEYVREFGAGWERTPGAVAWLRETPARLPEPEGLDDLH